MRTLTALLAALALLAPAASHASTGHTLIATVGAHDAYIIKLALPNGKRVTSLPAGSYTIVVHDGSKIHNFALGSQTTSRRIFTTGIPFVGVKTFHVNLTAGRYAYACSAHFATMNGHFTVT